MNTEQKQQLWVIEKEHIARLNNYMAVYKILQEAAAGIGQISMATDIQKRILDCKELRSSALNVLRHLS